MIRLEIKIYGIVQGVGFRPFIHKLVQTYDLNGWVKNTSTGVILEVEGDRKVLNTFVEDIEKKSPVLAVIERVETKEIQQLMNYKGFEIIKSTEAEQSDKFTLISPDVCICDECKEELFNKQDRRYKYPFINCTNCGPRFTIIKDIPYDRHKTTMQKFEMCQECSKEYTDISSRRYHAQPDCCYDCGPEVFFVNELGVKNTENPIKAAREYILDNKIIAIKGIGGIHLSCIADNKDMIELLRKRKHRDEKPFAIMCKDIDTVKKWCVVDKASQKLLESHRRPIVLLPKANNKLELISKDNNFIGVMLPYTPLHYLLLEDQIDTIVMTSGNRSDTPIIYKNDEALKELDGIADGFLLNDREIHVRCDDSLIHVFEGKEYPLRRSRGYVPLPIKVNSQLDSILACGAEQKASFAMSKQQYVFSSQHIGDMKNIETYENYKQQVEHFKNLFDIKPDMIACDLHPDYMSTEYAQKACEHKHEHDGHKCQQQCNQKQQSEYDSKSKSVIEPNTPKLHYIQHHHAHMASCMADNNLDNEKIIGVVWDGTGYGSNGEIWGGEIFLGNYSGFERIASIRPIKLPGGDKAVKEIYRIAYAMLYDVYGHIPSEYVSFEDTENDGIARKNEVHIKAECSINIVGKIDGESNINIRNNKMTDSKMIDKIEMMLKNNLNCPAASSIGRLFDGISALIGVKTIASYEGQGAIALEGKVSKLKANVSVDADAEAACGDNASMCHSKLKSIQQSIQECYDYDLYKEQGIEYFDWRPMVKDLVKDKANNIPIGIICAKFMNTLVQMTVEVLKNNPIKSVVLSGGVFQNMYLLKKMKEQLNQAGFTVFTHSRVSTNDEGIALGQIFITQYGGSITCV